jgi:hypothetical protein
MEGGTGKSVADYLVRYVCVRVCVCNQFKGNLTLMKYVQKSSARHLN